MKDFNKNDANKSIDKYLECLDELTEHLSETNKFLKTFLDNLKNVNLSFQD